MAAEQPAPAATGAGQSDAAQRLGLDQAALVGELGLGGAQLVPQIGGRGAARRVGLEGVVDDVTQLERQVAPQPRQRRHRAAEAPGGGGRPGGAHRILARPGLVEGQGERVDVTGGRHARSLRLLGRHVGERAHHVARAGEGVALDEVRHPEVGQLGEAHSRGGLGHHDHVLRLHVAVDDAARVRVGQRLGQVGADAGHVTIGQRPRTQQLGQGSAPNELGDEIDVVFVRSQLVDADDRRMVEPGRGHGLARHPLAAAALARDGLDGHLTLELLVPGRPDHTEAAGAQALLEPVAIEHQPGARRLRKPLCRVGGTQRQGAGLVRKACLGTVHPRFCFGPRRARPAPRSYSHRGARDAFKR